MVAMAFIHVPSPIALAAAGFASVQHVPVLFGQQHTYCREYNRFLRERATLDWHPDGHTAAAAQLRGRRIAFPSRTTVFDWTERLSNFDDWLYETGPDWRTVTTPSDGTPPYEIDLTEFAVGSKGANAAKFGHFQGRPELINSLLPGFVLRHGAAPYKSSFQIVSRLRGFWRFLETLPEELVRRGWKI